MNTGIRRVGVVMIVLFVALVAQLTYLQVARSDKLANDPHNTRQVPPQRIARPRADRHGRRRRSSPRRCPTDDEFKHPARLPDGDREAVRARRRLPVDPVRLGRRRGARTPTSSPGRTFKLAGRATSPTSSPAASPSAPSCSRCRKAIQQAAAAALAGRRGSVVVLDVQHRRRRRRVLEPDVRPEPAREPRREEGRSAARKFLLAAPGNPLLAEAVARALPAGLDVQDGDRVDRAPEQRRRRQAVPVRRPRSRSRRPTARCCGTSAASAAAARSRRASSSRATRRSARSASTSATRSRRASRTSACRPIRRRAAAVRPRPADRREPRARCPGRSSATSPRSRRPRSASTTSRSRRCRWRWSPRRSRPAA